METNREQQVADLKRRVQLEIKERKEKEAARLEAHKKKRSDEKIARRSTILRFWGKAQVGLELSTRNTGRTVSVGYLEIGMPVVSSRWLSFKREPLVS